MLSLPPTVRVFVAVAPLDMRGSFDALAGAVRHLGLDPVDGHLYLFLNKRSGAFIGAIYDEEEKAHKVGLAGDKLRRGHRQLLPSEPLQAAVRYYREPRRR